MYQGNHCLPPNQWTEEYMGISCARQHAKYPSDKIGVDAWTWVGCAIPHRTVRMAVGGYGFCDWDRLPALTDVAPLWASLSTVEDVLRNRRSIESLLSLGPHSVVPARGDFIWHDGINGVVWCCERTTGRVYIPAGDICNARPLYVAPNLGEFFARLETESRIAYVSRSGLSGLTGYQQAYVEHYRLLPHLSAIRSFLGNYLAQDVCGVCCAYLVCFRLANH